MFQDFCFRGGVVQLGHPEEEVRSAIVALLKQLATSKPAAVVYPVLVEHSAAQEGDESAFPLTT